MFYVLPGNPPPGRPQQAIDPKAHPHLGDAKMFFKCVHLRVIEEGLFRLCTDAPKRSQRRWQDTSPREAGPCTVLCGIMQGLCTWLCPKVEGLPSPSGPRFVGGPIGVQDELTV